MAREKAGARRQALGRSGGDQIRRMGWSGGGGEGVALRRPNRTGVEFATGDTAMREMASAGGAGDANGSVRCVDCV